MRGRTISSLRCSATFRAAAGAQRLSVACDPGPWWMRCLCRWGPGASIRFMRAVGAPSRRRSCCARCLLQVLYTVRSERPADGTAGLQPAVSVVCGFEHGRPDVGRDGVHQEPRAVAEGQDRPGLLPEGGWSKRASPEPAVGRALHGRWNLDRSVGGAEEFSAQR